MLIADPQVILLDEPAGGINPTMINYLAERIRTLNERGVTFLVVEHNMEFVMSLCHRVMVMHRGSKIAEGTPAEVRATRQSWKPTWEIRAMLLHIQNVYAGYDGGDVLKGISIAVEEGTTTCIVGPNGAGKSTVLRVLSGLLKPRVGEVIFDGHSIGGLSPRQILAMGIVQVPQNHSLFPTMTVRENVRLGAYTLQDRSLVERRLGEVEELFPIVKTRARDKAGNLLGASSDSSSLRVA